VPRRFFILALTLIVALALAASAAGEPRLRKALSMGSINNGGDPADLTALSNLDLVKRTGARWVRLWIRWDKAQLYSPSLVPWSMLDSPANDAALCGTGCGFRYIAAIDAQVAAARAAGLNVILVSWHFPRWANGTLGKPPEWAREDRGTASTPPERLKPMETRIPIGQLGPEGYFGQWLDWLVGRYAHYGRAFALEIMNEPNLQMWPQQGPSPTADPFGPGPVVIGSYVGEMMNTAQTVATRRGYPILMAGPALSDHVRPDSRLETNFLSAVPATLAELSPAGPSDNFVWTHHNYADVERGTRPPTRAAHARSYLVGRWAGRGGPPDPKIWLTEGGARLGSGEADDQARQAELVRRNWELMSASPGIEMWTNYLLFENRYADSGLREDRRSGGAPRPVWKTFAGFPSVR
jgi:hypothetical protein